MRGPENPHSMAAELLAKSLSNGVEDEKKVARRPYLAHHSDLGEGLHLLVGYVVKLAKTFVLNEAVPRPKPRWSFAPGKSGPWFQGWPGRTIHAGPMPVPSASLRTTLSEGWRAPVSRSAM